MRALVVAFLLLGFLLPVPAGAQTPGLRLSEILSDPEGGREFIEIWNPTPAEVDLAGWQVWDEFSSPQNFTFSSWLLPAGGRVVVWSGGQGDHLGPAAPRNAVWNNDGDEAVLVAPDGMEVDRFAYGTGPDAPPKGVALVLRDGAWVEGPPTPGRGPDDEGGTAEAEVVDVPPEAVWTDVPARVQTGASVTLAFHADDDNGPMDVASWEVSSGGAVLGSGPDAGTHDLVLQAPASAQDWSLTLTATDQGGQEASATAVVKVRNGALRISGPNGTALRFPPLSPGARDVVALDPIRIENTADDPVTPRFDISDLRSGGAVIPLAGNLDVAITTAAGDTTWVGYEQPLLGLPELAPGSWVDVLLKIRAVPEPLAAGTYGTSYTVVA